MQGVGPTREAVWAGGRPDGAVGQAREVAVRTLAEIPAEYGHPGVAKVSHRRRLSLVSQWRGSVSSVLELSRLQSSAGWEAGKWR